MTCNLPPKGSGHNVREICTRGTRASRKKNDPGHLRRETERAIRRVEQQQDTQWYLKSFEKYPGLLYGPLGGEEHSTGEKILSGLSTALMLVFPMTVAYGGHLAVKKISPYLGENFGYTSEQIKIVFLWSEMVREAVKLAQKASPPIGVAEAVDLEEILKNPKNYREAYISYGKGMTRKEHDQWAREAIEVGLDSLHKWFTREYGDKKIPYEKVDDTLYMFYRTSFDDVFNGMSIEFVQGPLDKPISWPDDALSEMYRQLGKPGIVFYMYDAPHRREVLGKRTVRISMIDYSVMCAVGLSLNSEYDDLRLAPADIDHDGKYEVLVPILPTVGKSYRVLIPRGSYPKGLDIDADNKSIPPWYEILEKRMTPEDLGLDGVNYGYETPSPEPYYGDSSVPYGSKNKTPGYEFSGAVLGAVSGAVLAAMRKRSKYPKKRR